MDVSTCKEKMVQIIANSTLEKSLKKTLKEVGVSGYTLFDVRGDGDSGDQSGHLEGDSNILMMVVVPLKTSQNLMEALNGYLKKGHHLMVFSVDADVLTPSKFG